MSDSPIRFDLVEPGERISKGELRRIYAAIPDVPCKGLCVRACGPVPHSPSESDAIRAATGRRMPPVREDLSCALLVNGRCTAYAVRPIICRLFGAAEGLECPHGCKPASGRLLTRREARRLIQRTLGQ